MSGKRPQGYCATCGKLWKLVRDSVVVWPAEHKYIPDHKSPSPVFGPVTKRCPGALKLPWGAPAEPRPEISGQTSILDEGK